MSAIPVLKPPVAKPQRRRRHRVTRPASAPRVQVRRARKAKARAISGVHVGLFALIACVAFLASSMLGQVMVENVRRQGLRAGERARDARKAEAILREELDALTSFQSVESWAAQQGFVAPGAVASPVGGSNASPVR